MLDGSPGPLILQKLQVFSLPEIGDSRKHLSPRIPAALPTPSAFRFGILQIAPQELVRTGAQASSAGGAIGFVIGQD